MHSEKIYKIEKSYEQRSAIVSSDFRSYDYECMLGYGFYYFANTWFTMSARLIIRNV